MEDHLIEKIRDSGLLGSEGDPLWNGKKHECCDSFIVYKHKKDCSLCTKEIEIIKAIPTNEYIDAAGNLVKFNKYNNKNNTIVAAMYVMYAMYKMGPEGRPRSLSEVGRSYNKSKQTVHYLFKVRGYKLRGRKKSKHILYQGKKYTEQKNGLYKETLGERRYLHKDVWEREKGKIPYKKGVYHKDRNKSNNHISNLECLPLKEIFKRYKHYGKDN